MKGVVKLKVPSVICYPKLFVMTLSSNGKQIRFSKVALDLKSAIEMCWYDGNSYNTTHYITHTELTINEINNLFKNFNP